MVAKIFDGRGFARKKELELVEKVRRLNRVPKLVSIVVGEERTSHMYVNLKKAAAERVGIQFEKLEFSIFNFQFSNLINKIRQLNEDEAVTGIMVQLPLPATFKGYSFKVVGAIAAEKDVDGLTGKGQFLPATVKAVLEILSHQLSVTSDQLLGKRVVVVGRSAIVGKPLAEELIKQGARVTVAHSQTGDLGAVTRKAEILISATGRPGLITPDMVKPGAAVIDVGEPKGDADEGVREVASWITPVPGGVGPVTVACLLENVVECSLSHTSR